jgi:hypothetical protein
MTTADLPFIAFAAGNALRIAAYFPQMFMLARQPGAAASFSFGTWALFTVANLSTALYAGLVLNDAALGTVHAFSALCCGALIGLALWRCRCPVAERASALGQAGGSQVGEKGRRPGLHAHRRDALAQAFNAAECGRPHH